MRTQDRVALWLNLDNLKCALCNDVQENHNHLFFGCDFSSKVWCHFKDLVRLDCASNDLYQVIDYVIARPVNKSIWCIIQRLVIGAIVYFLWQERNLRFFQGKF